MAQKPRSGTTRQLACEMGNVDVRLARNRDNRILPRRAWAAMMFVVATCVRERAVPFHGSRPGIEKLPRVLVDHLRALAQQPAYEIELSASDAIELCLELVSAQVAVEPNPGGRPVDRDLWADLLLECAWFISERGELPKFSRDHEKRLTGELLVRVRRRGHRSAHSIEGPARGAVEIAQSLGALVADGRS